MSSASSQPTETLRRPGEIPARRLSREAQPDDQPFATKLAREPARSRRRCRRHLHSLRRLSEDPARSLRAGSRERLSQTISPLRLSSRESLLEVGDDVVGIFTAYGDSQKTRRDPCAQALA